MQGSLSARLYGDREHGCERAVAQFIAKGSAPTSDADYVISLIDLVLYRRGEASDGPRGPSRLAAEPKTFLTPPMFAPEGVERSFL